MYNCHGKVYKMMQVAGPEREKAKTDRKAIFGAVRQETKVAET
jgi:hypothetical protein